jgi:chromosome partitioning protein
LNILVFQQTDSHPLLAQGGMMSEPEVIASRTRQQTAVLGEFAPQQLGDESLIISRELNSRAETSAHMITFANEKGGVGKSTIAFHCCVALCNAGYRVAVIDLDYRQQSMARALENREGTARRLKIDLPSPKYIALNQQSGALLNQEIARIGWDAEYVVIDVAGHDSPVGRHAIAMADTLVTPVNNSFVDIDLLGQFDPTTMQLKRFGSFARLVQELREVRDHRGKPPVDWVVVQNRLRRLGSHNEHRVADALAELSTKAGFRLAPGLGERVAYRELFLLGLTLFDLKYIPDFARAQPAAKAEMSELIAELRLETQTV